MLHKKEMIVLLIGLILITVFISTAYAADNCSINTSGVLEPSIELSSWDAETLYSLSPNQFPNFREDDFLALSNVTIRNIGSCRTSIQIMTINLSSGGTDYNPAFCLGGTVIPALEPNETYSFWYYRTVNFTYGREIYPTLYYLDSNKNNFSLCNEPLRQTGTWYAGINFNPNSPIGVHVNIGGFTIIDPLANIAYPPIFKVYDKETVLSLEQQQATLDLTRQANNASGVVTKLTIITVIVAIISLIVSIIGILFPLYHTKEIEVDKQKEIILSITAILDMLSEERDGQLVELKRSAIPSYNLTEVDSAFYITRLSSKFANKSTVVLKKNMIKLQSKVKNINDILNLARQSLVVRSPDAANDILNELRNRNFKYHSHLTVIIHSTRAELKKLL